jgi:hypothetical protein
MALGFTYGTFVLAEGLDVLKPTCYWWEKDVLYGKGQKFGWTDVWELNPEEFGSLLLMAYATWRGIILAEGLHDLSRRAAPLLNATLASTSKLRKVRNTCHDSRLVGRYSLLRIDHFLGIASTGMLSLSHRLTVDDFRPFSLLIQS